MSDIEHVVARTKRIEALLKELGVEGVGLVPLATSVKNVYYLIKMVL